MSAVFSKSFGEARIVRGSIKTYLVYQQDGKWTLLVEIKELHTANHLRAVEIIQQKIVTEKHTKASVNDMKQICIEQANEEPTDEKKPDAAKAKAKPNATTKARSAKNPGADEPAPKKAKAKPNATKKAPSAKNPEADDAEFWLLGEKKEEEEGKMEDNKEEQPDIFALDNADEWFS